MKDAMLYLHCALGTNPALIIDDQVFIYPRKIPDLYYLCGRTKPYLDTVYLPMDQCPVTRAGETPQ